MNNGEVLYKALCDGSLEPAEFRHRDHVAAAMAALEAEDFFHALARFADGLQRLTQKAKVPEKYNATLTMGFMSLIAEAMAAHPSLTADELIKMRPEIASLSALVERYSSKRLQGSLPRTVGLLPDVA